MKKQRRKSSRNNLDNECEEERPPNWGDLWQASIKVRGIAYLFSTHRVDPAPPLDEDEIFEGIGMILQEVGEELDSFARRMDEEHVARARSQRRSINST